MSVDVTLELGGIEERLTVTAEAPLVDTTSKEVGGNISAEEFVNTPSFNRSFSGFLGMVPGIVSTVSTSTFGGDTISVGGQGARNVELHDGRVGQQRRADRRRHQLAGARADRGRAGVQGVDQPVRRRVPAARQARSSTRCPSRARTSFTAAAFAFYQDQNLAAQNYFAKKSNLDGSADHDAAVRRHASAAPSFATRCISSSASSASCSTTASR